jgi:hypothetical protein
MHKDIAKKPGRASQKRHATFTLQAAIRLAERHVIEFVHSKLSIEEPYTPNVVDNSHKTTSEVGGSGSKFKIHMKKETAVKGVLPSYSVSLEGFGSLSSLPLADLIYPNLIEFLVSYFSSQNNNFQTITVRSEYVDEFGTLYRAHHDYRSSGFWHDWVLVSYSDDTASDGFTNVPAKLICFATNESVVPSELLAVCHPCQWRSSRLSPLVERRWLVPTSEAVFNNIPYDVVSVTALNGHAFVVPELHTPGVVYQYKPISEWGSMF